MLALALFFAVLFGLTAFMWHALTRVRGGGSSWWPWLANGHHNFWKTLLLGAMCIIPSVLVVALLSWLVSLVVWPLWLIIATLVLFIAAAITLPLVSRSGAGWPWWPVRFPRILAGLAMAAVGALVLGIVVSALVFRVPWGRLTAGINLPRIEMPAAGATETPEVIERVVEVECPEKLEKYFAAIMRGEMNCPIEGSTDSVTPGQDKAVNGMLLSCEICGGKPHLVVKGYVPTPTPAPANPPAGSQSSIVDNGSDRPAGCKTDAEVIALFGLSELEVPVFTGENVPWDHCKWNLQSPVEGLPLPAGWELTARLLDRSVVVYYGPIDAPLNVLGGTIRQLDVYNTNETKWANDKCELLAREDEFGMRRTPAYHTTAGNFSCAGTTAATETSAVQASACGSKDASWMASNIGGKAEQWTPPDWEGGAWVFHPGKENWTELVYPGFGKLDVWIGGATTITASNANLLESREFDEASFHCQ